MSHALANDRVLFLHIGPHKTATTYLQKMFCDLRDALRERDVDYPEQGLFLYGHHEIAQELLKGTTQRLTNALQTSQARRVLLSSENFDGLTEAGVDKLLAAVPSDWQVKVIYCVRRPDEVLVSTWKEEVKHGHSDPLSHFLFASMLGAQRSHAINHIPLLKNFAARIGPKNVQVFSYDRLSEEGADVFEFLLSECFSISDLKGSRDLVNGPMPTERIELVRALNVIHNRRTGWAPGNMVQETYSRHRGSMEAKERLIADHVRAGSYEFSLIGSRPLAEFCAFLHGELSAFTCLGAIPDKYADKSFLMPDPNWMHYGEFSVLLEQVYDHLMSA